MTDTLSSTRPDSKVLIGLTHGKEEPENVLIAYLIGVESPAGAALHDEYVAGGGRFFACPVGLRVRGLQDATWVPNAEVAGVPSVLEYTAGGALVFNY